MPSSSQRSADAIADPDWVTAALIRDIPVFSVMKVDPRKNLAIQ
jgi:hypothetical protein